jgi:hypothetical protein
MIDHARFAVGRAAFVTYDDGSNMLRLPYKDQGRQGDSSLQGREE